MADGCGFAGRGRAGDLTLPDRNRKEEHRGRDFSRRGQCANQQLLRGKRPAWTGSDGGGRQGFRPYRAAARGEVFRVFAGAVPFHPQAAVYRHIQARGADSGLQHHQEGMGARREYRDLWRRVGAAGNAGLRFCDGEGVPL